MAVSSTQKQRYPLAWPQGWPRKSHGNRATARFHGTHVGTFGRRKEPLTLSEALDRLSNEIRRLRVPDRAWLISSDLKLRNDGFPYSAQPAPPDPGVAVYFTLKGHDRVLACDAWTRIADNIAAIAAHIACIRSIDRYQVGTMDQAFAGYAALPAKGSTWRTTLGFQPDAIVTASDIAEAFKGKARAAHPDAGGSHDAMASLNAARTEGLAEIQRA